MSNVFWNFQGKNSMVATQQLLYYMFSWKIYVNKNPTMCKIYANSVNHFKIWIKKGPQCLLKCINEWIPPPTCFCKCHTCTNLHFSTNDLRWDGMCIQASSSCSHFPLPSLENFGFWMLNENVTIKLWKYATKYMNDKDHLQCILLGYYNYKKYYIDSLTTDNTTFLMKIYV